MDDRERALELVRMKGPVVPSNISKELGKDILFTSVILADLVSVKKLKISSIKMGSSPLYYLPEQEGRLDLFYKYLNEKDRATFEILKFRKVLRDSDQDPLVRVSLANIKDFAVPLRVSINGNTETFWRWHTLSNDEAEPIIKSMIAPKPESPKAEPKPEESKKGESSPKPTPSPPVKPAPAPPAAEPPKIEPKPQEAPKPVVQKEHPKEIPKSTPKEPPKQETPKNPIPTKDKEDKRLQEFEDKPDDEFFAVVHKYFNEKKISIVSYEIVKKNKEIDFVINLPSNVGKILFYCRARDKKRINDSDIASAFVQAQVRKLPLLFVVTGEPTKKASEMLDKEFVSVTMVKI